MTGRVELLAVLDDYLAAVAAGTPAAVRLDPAFRSTENGDVTELGRGLWEQSTRFEGIQGFADPETGQAVCLGVAYVDDRPRPFAQRVLVRDGAVAEAEAIVSTDGKGHFADVEQLLKPDVIYSAVVPEHRRVGRDGLQDAANRYWEGLQQSDGTIPRFNHRCDKYDNGAKTTNTLRTLLSRTRRCTRRPPP